MAKLGRDELTAALKHLVYLCARSGGVDKTLLKIEEVLQMKKTSSAAEEARTSSSSDAPAAAPMQGSREAFSITKRIAWADASDDEEDE